VRKIGGKEARKREWACCSPQADLLGSFGRVQQLFSQRTLWNWRETGFNTQCRSNGAGRVPSTRFVESLGIVLDLQLASNETSRLVSSSQQCFKHTDADNEVKSSISVSLALRLVCPPISNNL